MAHRIHVVTDSTASLPGPPPSGMTVVSLQVTAGERTFPDGVDPAERQAAAAQAAAHMAAGGQLTTSQPTRRALTAAFMQAAERGATGILAVHLSGALSGTARGAEIAAMRAGVPVRVVDSQTAAMGLGFAALAAVDRAAEGRDLADVESLARAVAAASRAVFVVESLDHLRRGGRLGAAPAALGSVFGIRPILAIRDGTIEVSRVARNRAAAMERVVAWAAAAAGECRGPRIAVHHVDAEPLAGRVADALHAATGVMPVIAPLSLVLAAHVGPGALAVVVTDWRAS